MKHLQLLGTILLTLVAVSALAQKPLDDYLRRPEPSYRWEKREQKTIAGGTRYTLWMVSQTWQGIEWDHYVQIFYPDNPRFPRFCALMNVGGRPGGANEAIGMTLARRTSAPFVVLYGIPKQPLYGGLVEDALIVYTWQKFFETGDPTWPLHLPMAKAVLKCMDTVQAFLQEAGKPVPERFLITGASKRGWTTWLVGASQDNRVAGIAPMVIDTLNLPAQVPHHLEFYSGTPSEQISEYTEGGMLAKLNTPEGCKLVEIEDPYSYRDRYTMPKLIINGTNDRYWALDALNLYWDGLKPPKWVLYVPNSGHGLEDRTRVLNTLSAFIMALAQNRTLPSMEWRFRTVPEGLELTVHSTPDAAEARLWTAQMPTRDFRDARWQSVPMQRTQDGWKGVLKRPASGWSACFAELEFTQDGHRYTLSTQLQMLKANERKTALPACAGRNLVE